MEYSYCCDYPIVNGLCKNCGEHCDIDEAPETSVQWIDYVNEYGITITKAVYPKETIKH